jgi:hypothetical protein
MFGSLNMTFVQETLTFIKNMHAAIKDKEQRQNSNSAESTTQGSKSKKTKAGTKNSAEEATSRSRYALPPTEIHDGWLFRKVG